MAWNDDVLQEYVEMLEGDMGSALNVTEIPYHGMLLFFLEHIENGHSLKLNPSGNYYLTQEEARGLHLMRAAYAFYLERINFYPWRLRDLPERMLHFMLDFSYQGLYPSRQNPNLYYFESVWDVDPGARVAKAMLMYTLWKLSGAMVDNRLDVITGLIQWMRDLGWRHVSGRWSNYEDYASYPPDDAGTYDYEDIDEVKAGECHMNSAYIVSTLRGFNIPAHVGRPWPPSPPSPEYWIWDWLHSHGHCCVHFPTEGLYMADGDDVQDRILKTYPPLFCLREDRWVEENTYDVTEYHRVRSRLYDDYLWWIIFLGEGDSLWNDVRGLYQSAESELRYRLNSLHIHADLEEYDGAPDEIPPIYSEEMVDNLVSYVAAKLT